MINSIINMENLDKRLEILSEDNLMYNVLWMYPNEFGETLEHAIGNIDNTQVTHYVKTSSRKFIEVTSILLIRKPNDIIYCVDGIKKAKNKNSFLSFFFNHKLLDSQFLYAIAQNKYVFRLIMDDTRILEIVMIEYIKSLLRVDNKRMLDIDEIFPHGYIQNMSLSTVEYFLSWLYEEKKLSISATDYFKQCFTKKYEFLQDI